MTHYPHHSLHPKCLLSPSLLTTNPADLLRPCPNSGTPIHRDGRALSYTLAIGLTHVYPPLLELSSIKTIVLQIHLHCTISPSRGMCIKHQQMHPDGDLTGAAYVVLSSP